MSAQRLKFQEEQDRESDQHKKLILEVSELKDDNLKLTIRNQTLEQLLGACKSQLING